MKTANYLYQIYDRGGTFTPAIIMDLFGSMNWPEECHRDEDAFNRRVQLFDGLYKGLYLMEVPVEEIEKHRRENTLDKLIHQSYQGRSSGYYRQFCDQRIVIGPTHIL